MPENKKSLKSNNKKIKFIYIIRYTFLLIYCSLDGVKINKKTTEKYK